MSITPISIASVKLINDLANTFVSKTYERLVEFSKQASYNLDFNQLLSIEYHEQENDGICVEYLLQLIRTRFLTTLKAHHDNGTIPNFTIEGKFEVAKTPLGTEIYCKSSNSNWEGVKSCTLKSCFAIKICVPRSTILDIFGNQQQIEEAINKINKKILTELRSEARRAEQPETFSIDIQFDGYHPTVAKAVLDAFKAKGWEITPAIMGVKLKIQSDKGEA